MEWLYENTLREIWKAAGRTTKHSAYELVLSVFSVSKQREKKIMLSQINRQGQKRGGGQPVRGDMSLEKIRTETQIKLKNMVVQHCTGKWELNG